MNDPLDAWRRVESAARAAEVAATQAAPLPDAAEIRGDARRLRRQADDLFSQVVLSSAMSQFPLLQPASQAARVAPAPAADRPREHATIDPPAGLAACIAAWRQAAGRAEAAEDKVVAAFCRYVAGQGPLPPLDWETDVAMHRLEAVERLERVYAEAKRLRKPRRDEFRTSVPGLMGKG